MALTPSNIIRMAFPVAPVTMPSDLAGHTNGKLNASLLSSVDGGGQLHHLAARAWRALISAAWNEVGLPLTFTYGGTYRSYPQQETLFRSRYDPSGAGGGCKTWNGVRWCKKSSSFATAAVPGTSNHGWGLAIDSAWDKDLSDGLGPDDAAGITSHPGWSWLLANAHRFGFSWELQSEPWHIRYVTGDNVPAEVLAFEKPTPPPVVTPPPVTPNPEEDPDMLIALIRLAGTPPVYAQYSGGYKVWIRDGNVLGGYQFVSGKTITDLADPKFFEVSGPIMGDRPAGVDTFGIPV